MHHANDILGQSAGTVIALSSIAGDYKKDRLFLPDTHKDWVLCGLQALWGVKTGLPDLVKECLRAIDQPCIAVEKCLGAMARSEPLSALEWLEKMCQERDPWIRGLHIMPIFDPLHEYPQFHELVRRLGLPEVKSEMLV